MKFRLVSIVMALGLLPPPAAKSDDLMQIQGRTMGTYYSVKISPQNSKSSSEAELKQEIEQALSAVNQQMSTYLPDSEISRLNSNYQARGHKISADFFHVLQYSLALAKETDGFFDPTVGPLVNLWGFGPEGPKNKPTSQDVTKALKIVGFQKITLDSSQRLVRKEFPDMYIDLSASAKGFAVDKISQLLSGKGLKNHLVDIGGELRAQGSKSDKAPWVVGVEKPSSAGRAVHRTLALKDKAIATSGNYRNFIKQDDGQTYSHTLNPKTGLPAQHKLASATVIDDECMRADGLATALMAMGPEKAWQFAQKHKLAVLLIEATAQGFKTQVSPEYEQIGEMP